MLTRIFTLLLFSILFTSNLQAAPHRALWVVRYALYSSTEITEIIDMAENLRISDLYVQVYALGMPFYNSGFFANNGNVDKKEPLNNLISLAHKRDIKVHAWINTLYIWSGKITPADKSHLFYLSQKSILRKADYQSQMPTPVELKDNGIEGYFLDPLDESNSMRIRLIITELISRYDLDGIHLDYFRYPNSGFNFSPLGRTIFKERYYIDPLQFFSRQEVFISERGFKSAEYIRDKYNLFLKTNLTEFLAKIHDHINDLDSSIILSLAVKPNPDISRRQYSQDWLNWLNNDLCDRLLLMNYNTDFEFFKSDAMLALNLAESDKIVIGISTYNQNEEAVLQRVRYVQNNSFSGFALFSYNHLKNNQPYLKKLKKQMTAN